MIYQQVTLEKVEENQDADQFLDIYKCSGGVNGSGVSYDPDTWCKTYVEYVYPKFLGASGMVSIRFHLKNV